MADYGSGWNYDNRRGTSPPSKRPRRDYDRNYGDRGAWNGREGDQLAPADILRNGLSSLTGLSAQLSAGVGLGNLGALGPGLPDPSLIAQASLMGYDPSRANMDILPPDASSTLYVDGLPSDCTRREAAHIFRPFIGFKEVRLVYKDAKRAPGEKLVLCFVEFVDAKCAATALEALQGYKFDENDANSYVLRLSFARYGPRGGGALVPQRNRSPPRGRDRAANNNRNRDRRH